MHRTLFAAIALVGVFAVGSQTAKAQELLATKGYGTLSGKVTLVGDIPKVVDLTGVMKAHGDWKCCLDAKAGAEEKVKRDWVVDPKTKGVANVVVWVKPPAGKYFDIPAKLKVRKEKVVIDQPHCAFLPFVSAYQPFYYDGKEMVATGQELILRNSSDVPHNVRAVADGKINKGFNVNVPAKTELNATTDLKPGDRLKAQTLPVGIECNVHNWMTAKLYVFDHPYYAISKADGSYEIPNVPAGAEVILMVHHDDTGWVLPELKKGRQITVKAGEKTTMDFTIQAPK